MQRQRQPASRDTAGQNAVCVPRRKPCAPGWALLSCFALAWTFSATADPQALPEGYRVLDAKEAAIQYPPDLEATAKAMLPVIAEAPAAEKVLSGLMERKETVLQFIAQQLGMQQPTRAMRQIFDAVSRHEAERLRIKPDLKHLRLYPVDLLEAAIASGSPVPGFMRAPDGKTLIHESGNIVYDAATRTMQASAKTSINVGSRTVTSPPAEEASCKPFFPMVVFTSDGEAGSGNSSLPSDSLQRNLREDTVYSSATLLHETVEIALIAGGPRGTSLLRPLDRWFSEGAADTIASLALDRFVAQGMGKASLQSTAAYSKTVQAPINLARWSFPGWAPVPSTAELPADRLEYAYYGVAAESVAGLLEQCGPNVLADITAHLRETRPMPTLSAAFEAVTGKSPQELLPEVYDPDAHCVAVGHVVVGTSTPLLWQVNYGIRPASALSLKQAMSGRLALYCEASALRLPARVELRLLGPDRDLLETKEVELDLPRAPIGFRFQPDPAKWKHGKHTIEIRINDVLCKELTLDIT